jgi:NitT/TauT family transport system ATP-binding protein
MLRDATPLIAVRRLRKTFVVPGGELPVLEGIDLDIWPAEVVALLGKSGSGKSTLLRCVAGLIPPSQGEVSYRGQPLRGTNPGTALVFQNFALLPWLTVQENVELGLEARGLGPRERAERARRAIDLVGLDGFESAYPKELSGGMRQRVGFARALVIEPDVLLMDEPFSALDVLTAENLRGELMEIWERHEFPTQAILMVTHNIEEAVLLADRVVVLDTNPGTIRQEIRVELRRPRDRRSREFEAVVERIYRIMTGRDEKPSIATPSARDRSVVMLPHASVDGLSGLLEIVHAGGGSADLAELASELSLEVDDLLPLVDAAQLLGFVRLPAGHLTLTPEGTRFATADIQMSKQMFQAAALQRVPLIRTIHQALERSEDGALREGFFFDLLRRSFSDEEARRQLEIAIDWGRYAELFEYDAGEEELALPDRKTALERTEQP